MSENLDLVRSIYADWERGNFTSADWAHPQIEYVIADGPAPASWTGRTGLSEGFRDFLGGLEQFRIGAREYREIDGQRLLVLVRYGGRGKMSGVPLQQMGGEAAHLWHVHDGKATRIVVYWDRDRAFAELGLRE
jgi:ketosteroid isomerase-like protein